jgi:CO dehydrogenase maturation factor
MTSTIALAGKGGVGKTTIAALVIKYLVNTHTGAVLAIDADPSTNLNMALGMEIGWTVGDIREDLLTQVKSSLLAGGAAMGALPGGVTKRDYLEYQIRSSLEEGDTCDLIAMGRSEGAGCYCAVNHNLREVVDAISKNYTYVVIDNEAGMEHLSRRTTRDVQHLLIVSDPSPRGLVAAERIASFRKDLDIHIETCGLILNRMPVSDLQGTGLLAGAAAGQGSAGMDRPDDTSGGRSLGLDDLPAVIRDQIQTMDIPLLGVLPADLQLTQLEMTGRPVVDLELASSTYRQVAQIMQSLGYGA